jgi:cell shape-determining protein MreC
MGTSWIHSLSFLDRVTVSVMVFREEVWLNVGSKFGVGAGVPHISKVLCLLVVKDYVVKSVSTKYCTSNLICV